MPSTKHDLHEVIKLLNTKIAELESKKSLVANSPKNRGTLDEMNAKLASAQQARTILTESCCTTQSCDFVWE